MDTIVLKKVLVRWEVKQTAAILAASVILPFLVHLVPPVGGIPLGARLLPMFYAPFIAIVLFRPHVAVISALLAPILNSLLTGHPLPEKVLLLTIEVLLFCLFSYLIQRRRKSLWVNAPLAYLLSAFGVCSLFGSSAIFIRTIVNSVSGIAMLTLLNIFLLRLKSD